MISGAENRNYSVISGYGNRNYSVISGYENRNYSIKGPCCCVRLVKLTRKMSKYTSTFCAEYCKYTSTFCDFNVSRAMPPEREKAPQGRAAARLCGAFSRGVARAYFE